MSAIVTPSKIPVAAHRRQSTSSNRGSPERTTPPTSQPKRKESPPSKIPTPASATPTSQTAPRERPQSIDIEDEFKNALQYTRLIATLQHHEEQSSPTKSSTEVLSPSRIPVAARKLSTDSPERSSSESSPAKTRRNGDEESGDDGLSPRRSKIPTLTSSGGGGGGPRSTSPSKKQTPTFGWSLPTERQTSPQRGQFHSPERLNRQHSSSASSVSSSTTTSRTNKSSDSGTEHLLGQDGDDYQRTKKKQYEAFVMTGDRMICLAKTPANLEFASKTVNHRQTADLQKVPYSLTDDLSSSVPSSPAKQQSEEEAMMAVTLREHKPTRDGVMRNSTSEDQLLLHSHVISPTSELLEEVSGSVDTLLGSSEASTTLELDPPTNKEAILTKNSQQRKASFRRQQQSSLESSPGGTKRATANSPDFSTSSLISSEHYNGESLLDHDNLSPPTSSSPETPDWSLMDSYHKQKSAAASEAKVPLLPIASADEKSYDSSEQDDDEALPASGNDEAIKSEGNRVIITIGTTSSSALTHPGAVSSSVADNEDVASSSLSEPSVLRPAEAFHLATNSSMSSQQNYPSLNSSAESSEESDLESLRSYHPPARPIDIPSAERLAKRLFYLDGFKRTDVSRHLGKNNDFSQVVAEEYLRYFDFSGGISLDMALRRFLQHFCLTGETQERERVLLHFSRRYLECNPYFVQDPSKQLFRSLDAVHTLTCAIMLLNTDLHGESVGLQRKMTCNEFIENLRELNDGQNFPRDLLRSIYYSIKETPIPWAAALEELPSANNPIVEDFGNSPTATATTAATDPVKQVMTAFSDAGVLRTAASGEEPNMVIEGEAASNVAIGKTGGGINPFIALPDPTTAVDFKKGYVMRKCCVDTNGKKTKLGKRSWRMYFVSLRDMVLYCFKDEKSLRQAGAYEDFSAAIRIHHGLAVRASDYTKKQFVFRLHTADRAEYLFQTSDEKELLTWIDAINYVVASFSAPQLPAPCGSAGRFQRPLMPSSKSSLGMSEQLASHESQLRQLRGELEELLRSAPPKHAKSTVWQNYREKEEFLQFEIMRYETYILTLRTKNAHDT